MGLALNSAAANAILRLAGESGDAGRERTDFHEFSPEGKFISKFCS